MTYDITELGLMTEPETIEPEAYVAPWNDTDIPVDKGIYESKLVDGKFKSGDNSDKRSAIRFGTATSKKTSQKYLMAEFAVEIQGKVKGKDVGNRFIYGRVDTIPERLKFDKVKAGRENANAFMDLLMAYGFTGRLASNDDYASALIGLVESGAVARASIDKDAYCNPKSTEYAGCGNSIRGEDNFTGVPVGGGQPNEDIGVKVVCGGNHTPGNAPILTGRNVIKYSYPTKK